MNTPATPQDLPTILDVEASSFGNGSYPIEVGFIRTDGFCYCSLIKPQPNWTTWSESSEKVHGIARTQLLDSGQSVSIVAAELNQYLDSLTVYSDAWGQDFSWLSYLFDEAGLNMNFKLEPLSALLSEHQKHIWHSTRSKVEEKLNLRRHRASSDAKILQLTFLWSNELYEPTSKKPNQGVA